MFVLNLRGAIDIVTPTSHIDTIQQTAVFSFKTLYPESGTAMSKNLSKLINTKISIDTYNNSGSIILHTYTRVYTIIFACLFKCFTGKNQKKLTVVYFRAFKRISRLAYEEDRLMENKKKIRIRGFLSETTYWIQSRAEDYSRRDTPDGEV